MPVTNPVEYTYTNPNATATTGSTSTSIPHPPAISKVEHVVAGLKTITYGLAELPSSASDVTCLWMLHPRLQIQECMSPFAAQFIKSWNSKPQSKSRGLIAVSFDQRNHGSRLVSSTANEAWRGGNEKHAQDMFSCYHGTSTDTSQLLDHIEAYIFPDASDKRRITQNIVFGISLGGHAAWHLIMQDSRFSAGIITIGCPDYTRLMSDRARLSKRKTWTESQGREFIGSTDFPTGLAHAVRKYDPAGLILGTLAETRPQSKTQTHHHMDLSQSERDVLLPLMSRTLANKRIINLSGGSDKLVPYAQGKPFLDWLKHVSGKGGFFEGSGLYFEDVIVDGAGHEVPPEMVTHMERFLMQTMEGQVVDGGKSGHGRRDSRM